MGLFDDFVREEAAEVTEGKYRVEITGVEEKTSQSGNPMLVIELKLNGAGTRVKDYILKNEWFNKKVTRVIDSFGLEVPSGGKVDLLGWIGAMGAANFKKDDKGYLKVQRYLSPEEARSLPEWKGAKPERALKDFKSPADDELPF